jgi:excinuclease ABC subunit A
MEPQEIVIRGAQQHNLKNINVTIPRNRMVVLTGVSGSGKSSLAFDTLYAEGQRRYVESLSAYARQFLGQMEKPRVDYIGGLSPAIAIEQKAVSKNPRSTVGTVTEVMDYLRVLYARIGTAHCPECGRTVQPQSAQQIADQLAALPPGTRFQLLAPIVRQRKGTHVDVIAGARHDGYSRARIDGVTVDLGSSIKLAKTKKHTIELVVDRLAVDRVPSDGDDVPSNGDGFRARLVDSVETTLRAGDGLLIADLGEGQEMLLSEHNACPHCNLSFPDLSPQLFSFNSPLGMCPDCNGLGTQLKVDVDLIVHDPTLSLLDGALRWYGELRKKRSSWTLHGVQSIAAHYHVDLDTPWQDLPEKFRHTLIYGSGDERIRFTHHAEWDQGTWSGESVRTVEGIIQTISRRFHQTRSDWTRRWYTSFMSEQPCPTCQGARLRAEARAVTVGGKTITQVGAMAIDEAYYWVTALCGQPAQGNGHLPPVVISQDANSRLTPEQLEIAVEVLKEIRDRLQFMLNVGLHYLTLDRPAPSLSGGEGQRIRLASQIGCGLVGVLYILDEPSIGLHARDNRALLDTLLQLRDMGNTVLVVEHDAETMRDADWLIDLGPGAGVLGGEVVAAGPPEAVAADPHSLTGRYLSGELSVVAPNGQERRRPANGWLTLHRARLHNLKEIDGRFPLGVMTCITGVSGSGKSSLISETLHPALARILHNAQGRPGPHERLTGVEHLDKVINITQSPIGRTPRSNPATYVQLFGPIRQLFASTPEAKARGYEPGRFSFNVKGGRCEACKGHGQKKIEMHFLADVWVKCQECLGTRFNRETLAVRFKGKNIADVLDMDVQEALAFFADHPRIARILQTLHDVGLDYIKLGQSATTLSGGEAQRVKLAKELSRVATGRTLYLLDEPTTGLHFADIQHLLDVLHRLTDAGNTVIIIEHNLDVIKTADWIIDLGPEGGEGGGRIVAEGPPEEVASVEGSYTGRVLQGVLAQPALLHR